MLTLTSRAGTLAFDGAPYTLANVDWGRMSATHGGRAADESAAPYYTARTVKITGYILAEGEGTDERKAFLRGARDRLAEVFDPAYFFTLHADGRSLICRAAGMPEYSTEAPMGGADCDMFTVTALARRPEFFGPDEISDGSEVTDGVVFPLVITEGFVFGKLGDGGTLRVINRGTLPAGCIIRIEAEDALAGLTVTSDATGEAIMFASDIPAGSVVEIDTRIGRKSAVITRTGVAEDGITAVEITENALPMLTYDSKLFVLPVGENEISWAVTTGAAVKISITLAPLFANA